MSVIKICIQNTMSRIYAGLHLFVSAEMDFALSDVLRIRREMFGLTQEQLCEESVL